MSLTYQQALGLPALRPPGLVRASNVLTWEHCPREYIFSCVFGIQPGRRIDARDAGSYAHVVWSMLMCGATTKETDAEVARMMTAVHEQYREKFGPVDAEDARKIKQAGNVGYVMGRKLKAAVDDWAGTNTLTPVVSEIKIETPGGTAQLDLLARARDSGLWVIDGKTAGVPGSAAINRFRRSLQARLNIDLANEAAAQGLLTEYGIGKKDRFQGFIVARLQRPSIRRKGLTGRGALQTLEDYVSECNEWWSGTGRHVGRASKVAAEAPLIVLPVRFGPDDTEGYKNRIVSFTAASAGSSVDAIPLEQYPVHDGSCVVGKLACPYCRICDHAPAQWRSIVERDYVVGQDILDSDPTRMEDDDE